MGLVSIPRSADCKLGSMGTARLQLYGSSMSPCARFDDIRLPFVPYATRKLAYDPKFQEKGHRVMVGSSYGCYSKPLQYSGFRSSISFSRSDPSVNPQLFSLHIDNRGNNARRFEDVVSYYSEDGASVSSNTVVGNEWTTNLKEIWQSTTEAAIYSNGKAIQSPEEITPQARQFLESHPYLRDVIFPVGATLGGTLLAWSLLAKILRRLHKYSIEGPGALLPSSSSWGPIPYENSFWGALEDPIRYFITFLAFLEIGEMVLPDVITSEYVGQAWKGGVVVALVWFLHQWKTNVITRALYSKGVGGVSRDKLLALDRVLTVGLFAVGGLALSEACGIAVQSILTVGGIGGVATAFASQDILGNVLSGLSVQITQPFSIGDTIQAGCVEGQVVEMGLTATQLLTDEKIPVSVPNSMFSSEVIVNKSRAKWHTVVRKIPIRKDAIDKVVEISEDIKSMLRSKPNVLVEDGSPYCFLSELKTTHGELTLGCDVRNTGKGIEQDILLEAVRIVKKHGAML